MDFTENVPDYEKLQLLMDQGPIVQEMMELETDIDTQYCNLPDWEED